MSLCLQAPESASLLFIWSHSMDASSTKHGQGILYEVISRTRNHLIQMYHYVIYSECCGATFECLTKAGGVKQDAACQKQLMLTNRFAQCCALVSRRNFKGDLIYNPTCCTLKDVVSSSGIHRSMQPISAFCYTLSLGRHCLSAFRCRVRYVLGKFSRCLNLEYYLNGRSHLVQCKCTKNMTFLSPSALSATSWIENSS